MLLIPKRPWIFEMNNDNFKNFLDVVNTVIDFYRLFEKSTPAIIEVWSTKLTHVNNLKETLDLQHKQKFYQKIWKDEQIFNVLKSFSQTRIHSDKESEQRQAERLQDLNEIDQELI